MVIPHRRHPQKGVGAHVVTPAGTHRRNHAVFPRTKCGLYEGATAKQLVVEKNCGVSYPGRCGVAGPLTAFARGIVGQRVFCAGAMSLCAGYPDFFQQRIAARKKCFRRRVIATLEILHLHRNRIGSSAEDMYLKETSAFRHQRDEGLPSAASDKAVEVAREAGGKGDEGRHVAAGQSFGAGHFNKCTGWSIERDRRSPETDASKIIKIPAALRGQTLTDTVAHKKGVGRHIFRQSERGG